MCEQKDRCPEDTVNEEECAYLSICTMCQGRGYVELSPSKNKSSETEIKTSFFPEIVQAKTKIKLPQSSGDYNDSLTRNTKSFKILPALQVSPSKKTQNIPLLAVETVKEKSPVGIGHIRRSYQMNIQKSNKFILDNYYSRMTIEGDPEEHKSKMFQRKINNLLLNNGNSTVTNTLPEPRAFCRPQEVAKSLVSKLNDTYWESRKSGVEDALQLSRYAPDILDPLMPLLNKTLCDLLRSLRSQVTAFACQAATELFCSMQSTARPEFDELVHCLLNRTADTNKFIRHNANEALDSMVTFLPPVHVVRALVDKGPYHKNPLVRTACARLLTCVVAIKTPSEILTHNYLRETCKRILESAAILLNDHNLDTRAAAKKLFYRFFQEEDFEEIYITEVDEKLRKPIEGALVLLKYTKQ